MTDDFWYLMGFKNKNYLYYKELNVDDFKFIFVWDFGGLVFFIDNQKIFFYMKTGFDVFTVLIKYVNQYKVTSQNWLVHVNTWKEFVKPNY